MIWFLFFLAIIGISFFLALRSMKNFQMVNQQAMFRNANFSLFLVKNKKQFTKDLLKRLSLDIEQSGEKYFSIESLFKGKEAVLALFGPKFLLESLPELELIEIEDYLASGDTKSLNTVSVNDAFGWIIEAKNNSKKTLNVKPEFLRMIDLASDQRFFWQIVSSPMKDGRFQVSIRAMVMDPNPVRRIDTAKKIENQINECTGLMKKPHQPSTLEIYKAFQLRFLTPKEITPFFLEEGELLELSGLNQ